MITDNEFTNPDVQDIQEREEYEKEQKSIDEGLETHQVEKEAQEELTPEEETFKSQFLRLSADFANFKRRNEKQREDLISFAQGDIVEKLLPFLDDLQRAFEAAEKVEKTESADWLEGFKLVEKNLKKQLNDLGLEEIEAKNEFNPELHEALMNVSSDAIPSGNIVQVLNKGYRFKGKVLRHAKVSVAQ